MPSVVQCTCFVLVRIHAFVRVAAIAAAVVVLLTKVQFNDTTTVNRDIKTKRDTQIATMFGNVIKKLCRNFWTKGIFIIGSTRAPKHHQFYRIWYSKCAHLTVSKWVCTGNAATELPFERYTYELSLSLCLSGSLALCRSFSIVIKLKPTWAWCYEIESSKFVCKIFRVQLPVATEHRHSSTPMQNKNWNVFAVTQHLLISVNILEFSAMRWMCIENVMLQKCI